MARKSMIAFSAWSASSAHPLGQFEFEPGWIKPGFRDDSATVATNLLTGRNCTGETLTATRTSPQLLASLHARRSTHSPSGRISPRSSADR